MAKFVMMSMVFTVVLLKSAAFPLRTALPNVHEVEYGIWAIGRKALKNWAASEKFFAGDKLRKYFHSLYFLEVGLGSSPSHVSDEAFMGSRAACERVRWCVGYGLIGLPSGFFLALGCHAQVPLILSTVPANADANLNVYALLKPLSEGWDIDDVSKHLLSVDMELVLSVPVPGCRYPDRLNYLAL
ncbi:hypothetical protein LWI29_022991 [Acer saccharum]|uniref:Uncharacterized protein n=1 Tax=Acer saccharum TaxID=4024 RepID=A0AA39W065_ACESA|nr:hypothetical protein LWI29_022991 [Acer saccharum]